MKIKLGVNIDHIATLRQVRAGTTPYPDLLKLSKECIMGGADQITIHLREDRRHIQDKDLIQLSKKCSVLLNLEMAATDEMLKIALKYKPNSVCLVPEKRHELTTEGGLNILQNFKFISKLAQKLKAKKIKISMFIDPSQTQVYASFALGADSVEFHTGHWVLSKGNEKKRLWKKLIDSSHLAHDLGLKVHAGHGLDYISTKEIKKLPHLEEVNIGHSLVCYALENGIKKSVNNMKMILRT